VLYSKGFNPRLKLSLPLPRSVGIEVDDDLLCLRVNRDLNEPRVADYQSRMKALLSTQLPAGLELLSVRVTEAKSAPQPCLAKYVLKVQPKYLNEMLKARIKNLLKHKRLNVSRLTNTKKLKIENLKSKIKSINVRPFLKSIELDNTDIIVECKISLAGSIRLDEIMELLELDYGMLSAPIRRTRVQWQESVS
jgi:radical SAM-linked protein